LRALSRAQNAGNTFLASFSSRQRDQCRFGMSTDDLEHIMILRSWKDGGSFRLTPHTRESSIVGMECCSWSEPRAGVVTLIIRIRQTSVDQKCARIHSRPLVLF
jgi:hypothetical protein